MAVNFTNLTANVNNIQALSDKPNITDGLTSAELKARFDKAGSDIKTYINGTHIPELEQILNNLITDVTQIVTDGVAEVDAKIAKLATSLGLNVTTWNSSTTYAEGDQVIYDYTVYEATVENTGITPTDTSYWKKVIIMEVE